jgi:hypothetical protein
VPDHLQGPQRPGRAWGDAELIAHRQARWDLMRQLVVDGHSKATVARAFGVHSKSVDKAIRRN